MMNLAPLLSPATVKGRLVVKGSLFSGYRSLMVVRCWKMLEVVNDEEPMAYETLEAYPFGRCTVIGFSTKKLYCTYLLLSQ